MATTTHSTRAVISRGTTLLARFLNKLVTIQRLCLVTTAEYGLSKAIRTFNSRSDKTKLQANAFLLLGYIAWCPGEIFAGNPRESRDAIDFLSVTGRGGIYGLQLYRSYALQVSW